MKSKLCILLPLLLVFSLLFSGCGKEVVEAPADQTPEAKETPSESVDTSEKPAQKTNQIVQALFASPDGIFNPIMADSDYDGSINDLVYSTLLVLDPEHNLKPGLAESYDVSEDNKTITFHLREGVKWHDGTPFSATDVAFTFNSLAKKDYLGPLGGDVKDILGYEDVFEGKAESLEGIKIVDEKTIAFTYKEVFSPGLIRIGTEVGIIAEHIWKEVPLGEWKTASDVMGKPVGTGPFSFTEYVPGQYAELSANPDYFLGKPVADKYIFRIANQDTAVAAIKNGEVDLADVSNFKPSDIEELEDSGIQVKRFPGKSYQYMGFNMREDIFDRKELRQAITYAIDRKTVIEQLLKGNGTLINAPMLPNTWQYPKSGINEYPFDPEKAAELLASIGYKEKDKDGILVNENGEKLTLNLKFPTGNKIREQYATVIKDYLGKVGIEVELEGMEFNALLDKVMTNHEFQMFLLGSSLSLDPDPIPYWSSRAASDEKGVGAWNIPGWRNTQADEYMVKGLKTLDQKERAAHYLEFAKIYNDDPPIVLLYAPNVVKAYAAGLKNYQPFTFVDYFNVHTWTVER